MAERDVIIRIRAIDEASAIFRRVALAAGAFVSFFALRRGVEEVTGEFIKAEASSITLAAALRATGEAAGFTVGELEAYADELMRLTTVDDDAFKRIMGIMATFRNVSGEVFKDSILLIADMSVQFGGLESGAVRLGKALNDPVLGMNALSRVGIQFSRIQKESIKLFVEQGNLMAAQQIILAELANQFGGQAQAQVDSFGGSIKQMSNAFGELKERMGKAIAEIPGLITGIQVATVLVENSGLVWDIVVQQMTLSLVGFWEDFKHFFTVTAPEIGQFFSDNWFEMLETLNSFFQAFFGNLAKNIWAVIVTIKNFVSGTDWEVVWTPMLDGFENTIGKFPELTKRVATDLEKALGNILLESQLLLGQKIGERLGEIAAFRDPGEPFLPDIPEGAGKGRAGKRASLAADEARFLTFGRQRQDDSRRTVALAEKAERDRKRQLAATERIAEVMGSREMQIAQIAITAFR